MNSTTRVVPIDSDQPDLNLLDDAAGILRNGGLVAFATETVYGLGADATNSDAVAKIFAAKGRPPTNPVIVHASDVGMARLCVSDWPATAETLSRHCWPGPLTLVLPRSVLIPDIVTANQETVAIRIPEHKVARALISLTMRPLAAPSANRSSGISPTLASHVLQDLDGKIDMILDSGQTTLGLESTVIDLTTRDARILRPGPISARDLEHWIGPVRVHEALLLEASRKSMLSPGQLAVHYAPKTRTIRVDQLPEITKILWPRKGKAALIVVGPHDPPVVPVPVDFRFDLESPILAARDLYVVMRQCDAMSLDLIVIVPPPDLPEWHAIRDRIWRAATTA